MAVTALTDWLDGLPALITTSTNWRQQRRLGGSSGRTPDRPRLIVIHTMETPEDVGRAASTARWVAAGGGTAQVSCHFTVDNAEAWRCVHDENVAFTQLTPWNDMSLSIEQAGRAAQGPDDWDDAYSVGQRALVARIVAAWCQRWGIPPVYLGPDDLVSWRTCTGVTTHHAITLASQRPELTSLGYKPGSHWDPGPNFPMDELLDTVRAMLSPLPPPTPGPGPAPTPGDDDVSLYVTNKDPLPNAVAALLLPVAPPPHASGAWPIGSLKAALDRGRIRRLLQSEVTALGTTPFVALGADELAEVINATHSGQL